MIFTFPPNFKFFIPELRAALLSTRRILIEYFRPSKNKNAKVKLKNLKFKYISILK